MATHISLSPYGQKLLSQLFEIKANWKPPEQFWANLMYVPIDPSKKFASNLLDACLDFMAEDRETGGVTALEIMSKLPLGFEQIKEILKVNYSTHTERAGSVLAETNAVVTVSPPKPPSIAVTTTTTRVEPPAPPARNLFENIDIQDYDLSSMTPKMIDLWSFIEDNALIDVMDANNIYLKSGTEKQVVNKMLDIVFEFLVDNISPNNRLLFTGGYMITFNPQSNQIERVTPEREKMEFTFADVKKDEENDKKGEEVDNFDSGI